jgi:hypothetical protein
VVTVHENLAEAMGNAKEKPAEEIKLECLDRENQHEYKPRSRISTRRNSDLERT